jgi:hypothetical protein
VTVGSPSSMAPEQRSLARQANPPTSSPGA